MCAIVDASVSHEVFGDNRSEAGLHFFEWLSGDRGKLVVGGKLRRELELSEKTQRLLRELLLAGKATEVPDQKVESEAEALREEQICSSNDEHVLALARVSGARLVFTNDQDLQDDFKNRQILGGVRGKVYTTLVNKHVTSVHRGLLRDRDLCVR